jgi:carotenoid 1,2-hydratase
MTERGRGDLQRQHDTLAIGPSNLHWDGNRLRIRFDEMTCPLPSRVRGDIVLTPTALPGQRFPLDEEGRHRWQPFAPCARVQVTLQQPQLQWTGHAYFDGNSGDEPLEAGFRDWDWSRATLRDASSVVLYEARTTTAKQRLLALHFDTQGRCETLTAPPSVVLPRSGWRVARTTRAELGQARVVETLEDTPFYARSLLSTRLRGEEVTAVHESLSLQRFAAPIVQCMLPFRMPRRAKP